MHTCRLHFKFRVTRIFLDLLCHLGLRLASIFRKTAPNMASKKGVHLHKTSDYRHVVTTPSMLFMGQILSQCPVKSCKDVALGLFVCNLFIQVSKTKLCSVQILSVSYLCSREMNSLWHVRLWMKS